MADPETGDNCSQIVAAATDDPLLYSEQGEFTVPWSYEDESGNVAQQQQTARVRDTIPPSIQGIAASPSILWPPNHQLVPVSIEVGAADNRGSPVSCEILSVESDEPDQPGRDVEDWEITGPLSLTLRAARSGKGTERTYSIQVSCLDEVGNASLGETQVVVPRTQP